MILREGNLNCGSRNRGTRTDLKWFFEQWFDRTGAPEWQVAWRQRDDGTVA